MMEEAHLLCDRLEALLDCAVGRDETAQPDGAEATTEAVDVLRVRIGRIRAGLDPGAGGIGTRARATDRSAWPEDVTPLSAYERPIIESLGELGGSASVGAVREMVFAKMQERLLPNDYRPQATTGEVLWRYRITWAAHHLRDTGVLKRGSPRGIWQLSELEGTSDR